MSLFRTSSQENRRAAHHRALAALPLKSTVVFPPPLDTLTTVGVATIDGRTLAFGGHSRQPRLWITADGPGGPRLLGHLTGLVHGVPDLWICDPEAWPWMLTGDNADRVEEAALRVWLDCQRTCDG